MNIKKIIPQAPISSKITDGKPIDQSWMMWFNKVGDHLNKATRTEKIETESNHITFSTNGTITYINYSGIGGFISKLPNTVATQSIIQTNDNGEIGHIVLSEDDKTISIPSFSSGIVSGWYFNK